MKFFIILIENFNANSSKIKFEKDDTIKIKLLIKFIIAYKIILMKFFKNIFVCLLTIEHLLLFQFVKKRIELLKYSNVPW